MIKKKIETEYKGPKDFKIAFITPDGGNFELIKDQIKKMDQVENMKDKNYKPFDVEFWDLKDLAKLMKLKISPFPESSGKESENKHEDLNPSLDDYNHAPSPYDDDELTP